MEISSFEELAETLRNFTTRENRGGYDFGGALQLPGASIDNIQKHAQQAELKEMAERLEPDQMAFLKKPARPVGP